MQQHSRDRHVSDSIQTFPSIFIYRNSYPCGHLVCSSCLATCLKTVTGSADSDSGRKKHTCIVCGTECDNTDPRVVPGLDNLKSAIIDENVSLWMCPRFLCQYNLYLTYNQSMITKEWMMVTTDSTMSISKMSTILIGAPLYGIPFSVFQVCPKQHSDQQPFACTRRIHWFV